MEKEACKNQQDSRLAANNQTYYFCCYQKNSMVDNNDCKKCKLYQFRER